MTWSVRTRKIVLTTHVVTSVGWLGAVATVLVLGLVGWTTSDLQMARAALLALEPITTYVVLPLAFTSLLIGVIQSLGSRWGLFRHYWIVFKLLINIGAVAILLMYMQTVSHLAGVASDPASSLAELRRLAGSPTLHAGLALLALLTATVLAVFKPRGMTHYGWRKRHMVDQDSQATPSPSRSRP